VVEDDETRWRVVEDALGVPRPSPPSPRFAVDIGRGGLLSRQSSCSSRAAAVELQSGLGAVSWRVASGLVAAAALLLAARGDLAGAGPSEMRAVEELAASDVLAKSSCGWPHCTASHHTGCCGVRRGGAAVWHRHACTGVLR
jgi:hypothetical protein